MKRAIFGSVSLVSALAIMIGFQNCAGGAASKAASSQTTSHVRANSFADVSPGDAYGYIDRIQPHGSSVTVFGWACMKGNPEPVNVLIYAGGVINDQNAIGAYPANLPSEDAVNANCETAPGTPHRFAAEITSDQIYRYGGSELSFGAYAISSGGGVNNLLNNDANLKASVNPMASAIYKAILGRDVEPEASIAVLNETPRQTMDRLLGSSEFQSAVGYWSQCSNACRVTRLYHAFLNRDAEPNGLNDWVGALNSGASLQDVMLGFAGSPEFRRSHFGLNSAPVNTANSWAP